MLQEIVSPARGILPKIDWGAMSTVKQGASVDTNTGAGPAFVNFTSNVDGVTKVNVCSPDISGVNSVGGRYICTYCKVLFVQCWTLTRRDVFSTGNRYGQQDRSKERGQFLWGGML